MQVAEKTNPTKSQTWPHKIQKVAVLGSGVMGSRIACHFANVGVEVLLLDIVPRELNDKEKAKGLSMEHPAVRNRLVNDSLKAALKDKRPPLYDKSFASRISTGNFTDDFAKIKDADWIIEVVVERLDIKQKVFAQVEEHRKPGSIITSNTSGIPIHMMSEGRSEDFRKHFLGTHFFNPPRFLRLLEIIPGPDTDPGLIDFMMHYGDLFLGKKTVLCKDTPAFIANRIGVYSIAKIFRVMEEMDLTIEEVDKLTGPATGKPKTGTFRLSDMIGLDTTVHVINGIRQNAPDDEQHSLFTIPAYIQHMVDNQMLGDKTGKGFFFKTKNAEGKREILSLDLKSMEYRPKQKVRIESLGLIKNTSNLGKKMKTLFNADDKGGEFTRKMSTALWAYCANRIPEIADNLYQIDDAMMAGFGWDVGPFAMWDMVGVKEAIEKFEGEGLTVASWITEMLAAGFDSFYKVENGIRKYYDIASKSYKTVPGTESLILLDTIREEKKVYGNADASVIDLGDGILNVEFHSKMNSIGEGNIRAIHWAIDHAEKHGLNGVVIANEGQNFSAGANIMLILMMASQGEWDELNIAVKQFQNTSMKIRYSQIPVVVAPHSLTLGGGCEFTMHSDIAVPAAETYIGLVEAGIGVIPGGAGTKEMALRAADEYAHDYTIGVKVVEKALMNIAMGKVASSAEEARTMGIIRKGDRIAVNIQHRIKEAKAAALELAEAGYTPKSPRTDIPVLGKNALATLYAGIAGLHYGHYASAHDVKVAQKTAFVLCGGDITGEGTLVSEQYLLDLEREAFLSLCGERKTLERMQHMLQTGKPLRN
ncbi:MAG: 3-hydroxyacyl-CoA dehydrogenase/enoyl-CoA hydratase family protein [Bacteroidota bacterium]